MKLAFPLCALSLLLAGAAHALFTPQAVSAYRVPNGKIQVNGIPDTVWREISALPNGYSRVLFNDYDKIVLLRDAVRNAPPEEHFNAPADGSVTLLAAFDDAFLYFLFLVKENNSFNPVTACSAQELWRAHAVTVFVDPAAWDTEKYPAYFSADAGEVSYGTSTKTFQVAKATWPSDTRKYYRDRTVANRFDLRTPAASLQAESRTRAAADPTYYAVEMRVPIAAADYPAGKSMFISWGYNHYPEGGAGTCDSIPVAYRWAKNFKSYEGAAVKPPGWKPGDIAHFDPLRSYDGWGRLELSSRFPADGKGCRSYVESEWDLGKWYERCNTIATSLWITDRPAQGLAPSLEYPGRDRARDIRGRFAPQAGTRLYVRPIP